MLAFIEVEEMEMVGFSGKTIESNGTGWISVPEIIKFYEPTESTEDRPLTTIEQKDDIEIMVAGTPKDILKKIKDAVHEMMFT
jgi:hypothetical protein